MKKSVLFVTYGGGHIAKVAPVVKELEARGVACTVLALTVGHAVARRQGLSPVGYRDFLYLVDAKKALELGSSLLEANQHPDVDEAESRAYLGINYLDWIEQHGELEARRLYNAGGRRTFFPLNFMGRLLEALRPSVVVSTSSPRSEQAAIEAAVIRGIPTLTIMDLFALPYDIYLRQPVHADRITVLSDVVRKNLVAAGISESRIRVTGCPAYDALQEEQFRDRGEEFRKSLGWEGFTVVMWAGYMEEARHTPAPYYGTGLGLLVEKRLRDWVSSTQKTALIVRYHPNQFHYFPSLGEQDRVYLAQPALEPVQTQLYASDTVVVQTSTVGLEAALIGKRVLNLRFAQSVIDLGFDYSELGIAEGVNDLDELSAALSHSGGAPNHTSALRPPSGKAAPRVADEIMQLAHRH